jgi:hypothetical protein
MYQKKPLEESDSGSEAGGSAPTSPVSDVCAGGGGPGETRLAQGMMV